MSTSSDSGAPALDLHFLRDARGSLQAERDGLLRKGRLLEELLGTVDEGVVLWNEDWRFLYTNAASSRILGIPEEELLGQRLWDVLPGAEDTDFGRAYRRVMEGGGSERLEAYYAPVDKWVENLVFRTSAGVGVVVRDVTERHRTAEAMSEAAAMERRVSAIVSHDLRNPLASLNVGIEVLLRRMTARPEDVTTLERMRRSVARMQEIIGGLLDASRGDGNGAGLPIERSEVDLRSVLEQVVDELRTVAGETRILLEAKQSAHGAFDGVRLSQAVSNLVTNALQHGSATEPVTVRLRAGPEGPQLEVHNHGPPIPESLQPHLFQPFTRGPDAGRTGGSVGLGLFIVQQIAAAHDGTVEVTSAPGEGTTFRLRLPWSARVAG